MAASGITLTASAELTLKVGELAARLEGLRDNQTLVLTSLAIVSTVILFALGASLYNAKRELDDIRKDLKFEAEANALKLKDKIETLWLEKSKELVDVVTARLEVDKIRIDEVIEEQRARFEAAQLMNEEQQCRNMSMTCDRSGNRNGEFLWKMRQFEKLLRRQDSTTGYLVTQVSAARRILDAYDFSGLDNDDKNEMKKLFDVIEANQAREASIPHIVEQFRTKLRESYTKSKD